jgi:hypothetical protein
VKRRILSLTIIASITLSSCGQPHSAGSRDSGAAKQRNAVAGDQGIWEETQAELKDDESRAAKGDNQAAETLFYIYSGRNDLTKGEYWLSVAANRGDCRAINTILSYSFPGSRGFNNVDTVHWKKKAQQYGCN